MHGQRLVKPTHRMAHMASALRILLVAGFLAAGPLSLWPVSDLPDAFTPGDSSIFAGDWSEDGLDQHSHDFPLTAWASEAGFAVCFPFEGWFAERHPSDSGCILTIQESPRSPPASS